MTRKHFNLFAEMFKNQLNEIDTENQMVSIFQRNMLIDIIRQTMVIFQMNNPRFDRYKFWNACGLSVNDE